MPIKGRIVRPKSKANKKRPRGPPTTRDHEEDAAAAQLPAKRVKLQLLDAPAPPKKVEIDSGVMPESIAPSERHAEAIAAALGHNFFLQPAVVKLLTRYFMVQRPVFDELTVGRAKTLLEKVEEDVSALAAVMLRRPVDLELYGTVGVLTTDDQPPHPVGIFHWAGPAFGFTDELLLYQCGFYTLGTALGSLSSHCDLFWTNVRRAELVGHFQCSGFKYMRAFAAAYFAPLWLAHLAQLSVEQVLCKLPPELTVTDGLAVMQAVGRGLALALRRSGAGLTPQHRALVTLLSQTLAEAPDFEQARRHLAQLTQNLDGMVLHLYDQLRGQVRPNLPAGRDALAWQDLQTRLVSL